MVAFVRQQRSWSRCAPRNPVAPVNRMAEALEICLASPQGWIAGSSTASRRRAASAGIGWLVFAFCALSCNSLLNKPAFSVRDTAADRGAGAMSVPRSDGRRFRRAGFFLDEVVQFLIR